MRSKSDIAALRRLAELHSIQIAFTDTLKRRIVADRETLVALLRARGVEADSRESVQNAIARRTAELALRVVEPVNVVIGGRGESIPLRANGASAVDVRITCESGERMQWNGRVVSSPPSLRQPMDARLELPELPIGYHQIEVGPGEVRSHLFVAPPRAFERRGKRWGIFAPLYAIRSQEGNEVADVHDVERFLDWASAEGSSFLSTLPVLASYLDVARDPSPYAPVSRLFWNELYLDVDALPEVSASSRHSQADERLIDYGRAASRKREILNECAAAFFRQGGGESPAFHAFLAARPEVNDYARFSAATERQGKTWPFWSDGDARDDAERARYHLYVQFRCEEQMQRLADHARNRQIGLYLDFPLGSNAHGYDVWKYRELYVERAAIGAPPDLSYASGQNWGFRPLDPDAIRADGYRHWIECVRHQLRVSSMLRLDHVMGLHRLYWIPDGFDADRGAYVRYRSRELYAILAIESHRCGAEIVGEDLGTVPFAVRRSMAEWGVKRLYVVQRELTHGRVVPPEEVSENAVASLNTHDMPPFASFWEGSDLDEKAALRVIDPEKLPAEKVKREAVRVKFAAFLHENGFLESAQERDPRKIYRAAIAYLAASGAGIVLLNVEDLWGETIAQNIPTTTTERPNWRLRLAYGTDEIPLQENVREVLRIVQGLRGR